MIAIGRKQQPVRRCALDRGLHRPSSCRLLSLPLVLALLAAAPGLAAAPQTVAEIAAYKGADRSAIIDAGARKDGQLTLYTGATSGVIDDFRKKYPFLTVETGQGDAPAHVRRITEEYAAGRHIVDVVATSNGGMHALKEQGVLQPFVSPELAAFRADAVEPGGHWAMVFESYVSLGFNTRIVAEAEAPKTLDDLLDPKWRGRMALARTTMPNWIGAVVRERGAKGAEDYLRRLAEQKIRLYQVAGRALANMVVSGEVPLSPSIFSSHIADSRRKGASVAWRPLDGVYANVSSVALAKQAPHPHAAMLYIDFIVSREGQLLHQAMGYSSGRSDIEGPGIPAQRYYLSDEPTYASDYEAWESLGRRIFGAGETPAKGK